jgi:hypothetical protein
MTNYTITADEIAAHRPDVLLPPDEEFAEEYAHAVRVGREIAAERSVSFVMICRNSQPWLRQTLALIEGAGSCFKSWSAFAMENDSADNTKEVLKEWCDHGQRCASLNMNYRPHLSHTMTQERTVALAEYRSDCQWWVRNRDPVDYVAVLDSDSWGGFSVDGLMTSVAHIETEGWWGLASYSWAEAQHGGRRLPIHYDAWACRWTWWGQRSHHWFHAWLPPVGSRPVEMNSAFGQLALYRSDAYLRGRYSGETCEHVPFHRSIAEHPETIGRFGLNPSSRCVSFWVPTHGGQHGGD